MPPMELRKSTVDTGMPSVWTSSCHTGFPWLAMAAKKGIWQTERGFHLIYRDVCQNFGILPWFTSQHVFFPTGYRFCFSWLFEQTHAWGIDCVSIIISNSATFLSTILGLLCVYIYILFNIIYMCIIYYNIHIHRQPFPICKQPTFPMSYT